MARMKLETLGLKSLDSGFAALGKGAVAVGGAVGGTVGGTMTGVVSSGLTGVFSLGKGFRDFILRGTVVELAVAVVLGTAFTNLITAVTSDFITPLIGAIFRGASFWELSFEINGSTFKYGDFINQFVMFILVCLVLYFGVVLPLNKLQYAAFKHKAIQRDCPRCLEEISCAATRCKHCCADIEVDESLKQVIVMAEAAMQAQQQKHSWCMRMLTCCVGAKTAVLHETPEGEVELKELPDSPLTGGAPATSLSRKPTRSSSGSDVHRSISRQHTRSTSGSQLMSGEPSRGEVYRSPTTSFSGMTNAAEGVSIDVQQLEAAVTAQRLSKDA